MWVLCNVCFLRILPKALGNRTPPPLLCRTLSRREGFWSKTKTQQKKQKSNKCGVVFAHSTTYSTERKEKTLDKGCTKLLLVDVKYRRKQSRYQIFKAAQWRKNFRNCAKLLFFSAQFSALVEFVLRATRCKCECCGNACSLLHTHTCDFQQAAAEVTVVVVVVGGAWAVLTNHWEVVVGALVAVKGRL